MAFIDKMKDYFSKGVEVSKDALSKAGDAVQDLGDKSVLMIEIKQFESKLNKEYVSLGQQVYSIYHENGDELVKFDDAQVSGIIAEIKRLRAEISVRKEKIQEIKDSSNDDKKDEEKEDTEE